MASFYYEESSVGILVKKPLLHVVDVDIRICDASVSYITYYLHIVTYSFSRLCKVPPIQKCTIAYYR